MKLRRILITLVVISMIVSLVPGAFAATPGINVDFTNDTFDTFKSLGSYKPTNEAKTGVYGKAQTDTSMAIVATANFTGSIAARAIKENVALTKSGSRLSFKIAAADYNSEKSVSFGAGVNAPATALFNMAKDGKMYLLGNEICSYETGRWYQVDIEFANLGAYTVYIDGGYTKKLTGTSDAMSDLFGTDTADSENRNLFYYLTEKTSGAASTMYIDDFETETSDANGVATMPASRKIDITYSGEAIFENGQMKGFADLTTVADVLADFSIVNGVVKILNYEGTEVTSGELAPGMTITIASADNSSKFVYSIDCLNLRFFAPDSTSTRATTQEISVSFAGAGSVEFYVNDEKMSTDTEAPYTYTVEHDSAGDYKVYAIVETEGNIRTKTSENTYTYTPNIKPIVSVVDENGNASANAGVEATKVIKLKATATDSDGGIKKIELYYDGSLIESNSLSSDYPQTMTLTKDLSGLTLGNHTYYAVAEDADGGVTKSETVMFTVIESETVDIDSATFEGTSTIWEPYQSDGMWEIVEDGASNHILRWSTNGTQGTYIIFAAHANLFASGTIFFETDFKTNNANARTYLLAVRSPGDAGVYDYLLLKDGKIDNYTIEPNKWYRIRQSMDVKAGKVSLWISDDAGATYTPVSIARDMETSGEIDSLRMEINRDKVADYDLCVDNIKLYSVQKTLYLAATNFLDSDGNNVEAASKVDTTINKVQFVFNDDITYEVLKNSNFVITDSDGKEYTKFNVSVDGTKATITFNSKLTSKMTYTIKPKNLGGRLKGIFPYEVVFTVDAAPYDVTASTMKINGQIATSLSGISTGDTLQKSMTVQNTTGSPITSVLIYAIYSGNKLIGVSSKPVTINPGGGEIETLPTTITGTIRAGEALETKVFFWSDLGATRSMQMEIIK